MNFELLVNTIQQTHNTLQQSALKSVNKHLTIRNWLVGFYIVEFEQKGKDRANYGEKLLDELASSINIKGLGARNLKLFRQFYFLYPQIVHSVIAQMDKLGFGNSPIRQLPTDELQNDKNQPFTIVHLANAQSKAPKPNDLQVPPERIIDRLSFTHLVQLFPIEDPLKRTFYEIECIKGNWKVEELRRQINSLYFERSGMSNNPEKLSRIVQEKSTALVPTDIIKSPFTFEFLGLKAKDVVYESDLEQALIDHLEEFLLELGHGFCFEAKQKRILIGDRYYFIDLVFYHRILKCHILIDLKMKEVEHENIGQLKTYINYYKKNIMLPDDNPPVALLLVTENNKELVEYAVADSDQQLFVSKYILELPSTQQLEDFIRKELRS
ncbi:MAG: cytoplasmic protein [Bacteroidetes bacterium RIFCSPLOWO2_12_FULL_35_15]|nr:MAG: cytoplasmic protein [Bacteroidetes bacterium RIFCSPLOWO2_12_FULL_35_15]